MSLFHTCCELTVTLLVIFLQSRGTNACIYEKVDDTSYRYVQEANGVVYRHLPQPCQTGFVFNQEKCACILGTGQNGEILKAGCIKLAYLMYNTSAQVYKNPTYVEMGRNLPADYSSLTVDHPETASRKALLLARGDVLDFHSFVSNELVGPWEMTLRIRPSRQASTRDVTLLTDECSYKGKDNKVISINTYEITLMGNSRLYILYRNKLGQTINETCQVTPDSTGWFVIRQTFMANKLSVSVNKQICIQERISGVLPLTNCGLYLGGSPLRPENAFWGWIDYFMFIKQHQRCPQ